MQIFRSKLSGDFFQEKWLAEKSALVFSIEEVVFNTKLQH